MAATQTAVTADQFIAEVRKVAAERPDYIYENPEWGGSALRGFCKYMHGDEPGCIIGTAAFNLGLRLGEGGGVLEVLALDQPTLYGKLTSEQGAWLGTVQRHQDDGKTWADAVAMADRLYPNV